MTGVQYSYKIKYDDISALYLLEKPDKLRSAFVIALEKPVRQGTQKYQNLVIETHGTEQTVEVNVSEEDMAGKYDGQLSKIMKMPLASLIAKIFKVLTQTPVYVPKLFKSARDDYAVRCNFKSSDGLLYPLAKSIIFINKPTIILNFNEIESVEFARFQAGSSATKSIDLVVTTRTQGGGGSGGGEKFTFASIDRAELFLLQEFFKKRDVEVLNPQDASQENKRGRIPGTYAEAGEDDDDEGSDDGDYKSGQSSHSGDSDDSGTDEEGSEDDGEKKKPKKAAATSGKVRKAFILPLYLILIYRFSILFLKITIETTRRRRRRQREEVKEVERFRWRGR